MLSCVLIAAVGAGCGGLSQNDMKRYAVRRTPDDEAAAPANTTVPKNAAPPSSQVSTTPANNADTPPPAAPAREQEAIASALPRATLSPDEQRHRTLSNLSQLCVALERYAKKNGRYPARAIIDAAGNPLLSWRVELLPYLGLEHVYRRFHLNEPWDSVHNRALVAEIPPVYQSPHRFDDRTNYLANSFAFPMRLGLAPGRFEDGLSNTALLIEVEDGLAVPWTKPDDFRLASPDPVKWFDGLDADGFFVVWGGGLVGHIRPGLTSDELLAMLTIDGGESFSYQQVNQPVTLPNSPPSDPSKVAVAEVKIPGESMPSEAEGTVAAPDALAASFQERAELAFREGRERDGFQWLYAAALVAPEDAGWREQMQWFDGLKRPALAVRWGIGITYTAPRNLTQSPAPIGTAAASASRPPNGGNSAQIVPYYTGELGDRLYAALEKRIGRAAFGGVLADSAPGPASSVLRPVILVKRDVSWNKAIRHSPGVMILGTGSKKVLLHLARKEGVDVLVQFDVSVKPTRTAAIFNSTTLRLFDVATGAESFATHELNNLQVLIARQDPLQDDPVDPEFKALGDYLDEHLAASKLPSNLNPEHARGRVAAITSAESPDNPLALLVEIRFYHALGLISDLEMDEAFAHLIGADAATTFLHGVDDAKRDALLRWLPEG